MVFNGLEVPCTITSVGASVLVPASKVIGEERAADEGSWQASFAHHSNKHRQHGKVLLMISAPVPQE
eukprot:337112-Amphidinium_carterae.1